MTLLFVYLFLALGVSFLCSILEAVLLSVNQSYIAVLENQGRRSAKLLRKLKDDIDRPLSAILSLNTIAHTVGAAGVGAQAQIVFGYSYVGITSAILTLLILFLSEIIPKTLGATYWKVLAPSAARTLRWMIWFLYPFVVLSMTITRLLSDEKERPTFSREEFSAMADRGVEEGVFEKEESDILKNLVRFNSLRIKDIMTPRVVVVSFHEDTTVAEVFERYEELRFSRLPVYGEKEDDITGYILKNDLLIQLAQDQSSSTLKELKRDILILPELISLQSLFEQLLENQEHIAVAVDEYGGFSGIVTMEDVVETLLGMEIVDEVDAIEDMQKQARENWRKRAKKLGIVEEEKDMLQEK
ncbi:MAG: HlyC/CorC family transporter [Balneolaceae bacterium]|nr:HlyC/CorC family transporter [Balneolaceae bacterium]